MSTKPVIQGHRYESRTLTAREAFERADWELQYALRNWHDALRALESERSEQAGARLADICKTGELPF